MNISKKRAFFVAIHIHMKFTTLELTCQGPNPAIVKGYTQVHVSYLTVQKQMLLGNSPEVLPLQHHIHNFEAGRH